MVFVHKQIHVRLFSQKYIASYSLLDRLSVAPSPDEIALISSAVTAATEPAAHVVAECGADISQDWIFRPLGFSGHFYPIARENGGHRPLLNCSATTIATSCAAASVTRLY